MFALSLNQFSILNPLKFLTFRPPSRNTIPSSRFTANFNSGFKIP